MCIRDSYTRQPIEAEYWKLTDQVLKHLLDRQKPLHPYHAKVGTHLDFKVGMDGLEPPTTFQDFTPSARNSTNWVYIPIIIDR